MNRATKTRLAIAVGTVVTEDVPDTTTTTTSSGGGAVGLWQLLSLGLFSRLGYRRRKALR